MKYLEKVKGSIQFDLTYVPREHNVQAGLLSKLASMKLLGEQPIGYTINASSTKHWAWWGFFSYRRNEPPGWVHLLPIRKMDMSQLIKRKLDELEEMRRSTHSRRKVV